MLESEKIPQQEGLPKIFDIQFESLPSMNHPDRNEDAVLVDTYTGTFGVFDGMGGHAAGDRASREARDYIERNLQRLQGLSLQLTQNELKRVLSEANEKLLQLAEQNPELAGMGTTASIVKIWEGAGGERKAIIANVGDSRVYIRRAGGRLKQITLDDNIVSHLVKNEQQARRIQSKLNNVVDLRTLSDLERYLFEQREKIWQALGMRGIKPRMYTVDIHGGEKFLITSDGIPGNLTHKKIAKILGTARNNREAVNNLIYYARKGGHPDDMSAVIFEVPIPAGKKPREQVPPQELREGDVVRVLRSNGVIESDWEIFGFDKHGVVIVMKNENGQILQKRIPLPELRKLNPPGRKTSIAEAKDFTELFEAIRSTGGLPGTKKFYGIKELEYIVNQVRAGKLPLETVTRTDGLRERVKDLLKLEKLRRNI